jgi:GTP-binding protein EngB required for normal cell division
VAAKSNSERLPYASLRAEKEASSDQDVPAPPGDSESLRHYTDAKLAIAGQLRTLLDLLKHRGDEAQIQRCEELLAKLAEDRFTIALLGQFKRGKSSLLNAIIGRDLLPTGILPLTSAITVLRFGSRERLVIYRKGLQSPVCDSIDTLGEYVTERHNPGNNKGVELVVIEIPLPFLRRGLEFVDTPGVGSAIQANTETTYSFLPKCDAVLFVTSADGPLSEVELELLRSIRRHAGKIFFIVNKIDLLLDKDEATKVMDFIKSRLSREMEISEVGVIPLSAKQALAAEREQPSDLLAQSGLPYLQDRLAHFLATDRQRLFLAMLAGRAHQLVTAELQETELSERAERATDIDLKHTLSEITAKMDLYRAERLQIFETISASVTQGISGPAAEDLASALEETCKVALGGLDRFVTRAPFVPAGSVARRYTGRVRRLLWTRLLNWVRTNRQNLANELNVAARPGLEDLGSNLAKLASLPHQAFGLAVPKPVEFEHDHFKLDVQLAIELGADWRWNPHVPFAFRYLPTVLVRPWLRKSLRNDLYRFAGDQHAATLGLIQGAARESVTTLARRISAEAAKLERHTTALLSAKSGSKTNPEAKQAAQLYRRGLQSLSANFSGLRSHSEAAPERLPDGSLVTIQPISSPGFDLSGPAKIDRQRTYATQGCPVCDYLVGASKQFFAAFQYSLYNDEGQQRAFAENGGFCPFHLWQLQSICSPIGFSAGAAKLVKRISKALELPATIEDVNQTLRQIRPSMDRCPACISFRQTERQFIGEFITSLSDAKTRRRYARSRGVCLQHLEMALAANPDAATAAQLLATASLGFQRLAEEMEGFALKREASRRDLVSEDEERAHIRAAIHLAGAKHNCMPWTFDDEI